jgi:hypothetical protein
MRLAPPLWHAMFGIASITPPGPHFHTLNTRDESGKCGRRHRPLFTRHPSQGWPSGRLVTEKDMAPFSVITMAMSQGSSSSIKV